jgi:hypothetical protein
VRVIRICVAGRTLKADDLSGASFRRKLATAGRPFGAAPIRGGSVSGRGRPGVELDRPQLS